MSKQRVKEASVAYKVGADKRITVTLPSALAEFVEGRVREGFFVTESDVVRYAILDLMSRFGADEQDRSRRAGEFVESLHKGQTRVVPGSTKVMKEEMNAELQRIRGTSGGA